MLGVRRSPRNRWLGALSVAICCMAASPRPFADERPSLGVPADLANIFQGRSPRTRNDLRGMQNHTQRLAAHVSPAVVHVRIGASHGSGVVVSDTGLVLTAAHVVGAPGKEVIVRFADGHEATAETLGVNLEHDLSLLQLSGRGPWRYLPVADPPTVRMGEWCAALGHPGGFVLDRGPVFRMGRILDTGNLLRSDCQLIGGDSGGPLVNMRGEVIGIHSRIGTSLANNLHIPATVIAANWEPLTRGEIRRGGSYIGVRGSAGTEECVVFSVAEGSPAERAGIRKGDVITHFSGQRLWSFSELVMLVQMRQPGERVPVRLTRNGEEKSLVLRIGSRDDKEVTQ